MRETETGRNSEVETTFAVAEARLEAAVQKRQAAVRWRDETGDRPSTGAASMAEYDEAVAAWKQSVVEWREALEVAVAAGVDVDAVVRRNPEPVRTESLSDYYENDWAF
jgi:hypothetical protein